MQFCLRFAVHGYMRTRRNESPGCVSWCLGPRDRCLRSAGTSGIDSNLHCAAWMSHHDADDDHHGTQSTAQGKRWVSFLLWPSQRFCVHVRFIDARVIIWVQLPVICMADRMSFHRNFKSIDNLAPPSNFRCVETWDASSEGNWNIKCGSYQM